VIRHAALIACYAVVVVCLTWPLAGHVTTHLPAPGFKGDVLYSTWTLAWQTHALLTDPARIADARIYYPTPWALFYGPLAQGALPVFVPAWLLSGDPTIAINVVLLAGLTLLGWGAHCATQHMTGCWWAGLAAGGVLLTNAWIVWGFVPNAPHYAMLGGFPWIVALAARPALSAAATAALAALVVLQSLTDVVYVAPAVLVPLAVLAGLRLVRPATRRTGARLGVVLAIAGIALVPAGVGFWFVRQENPSLLSQTTWKADAIARSRAFAEASRPEGAPERRALFDGPLEGVTPLVVGLVVAGALAGALRRDGASRTVWLHGILWCVVGVLISRSWLVATPMRLPTRLGVGGVVGLAVLVGAAVTTLAGTLRTPRARAFLAATLALTVWTVGYLTRIAPLRQARGGLPLQEAPTVPPAIADALARMRGPLLELPLGPPPIQARRHATAMYHSLAHGHPVLNGYASYWPMGFPERMALADRLPDSDALDELVRSTGLRLVWVHVHALLPDDRARWKQSVVTGAGPLVTLARAPGELLLAVGPLPGAVSRPRSTRASSPGRPEAAVDAANPE
jgi:hypothetical protein